MYVRTPVCATRVSPTVETFESFLIHFHSAPSNCYKHECSQIIIIAVYFEQGVDRTSYHTQPPMPQNRKTAKLYYSQCRNKTALDLFICIIRTDAAKYYVGSREIAEIHVSPDWIEPPRSVIEALQYCDCTFELFH